MRLNEGTDRQVIAVEWLPAGVYLARLRKGTDQIVQRVSRGELGRGSGDVFEDDGQALADADADGGHAPATATDLQ